MTVNGVFGNTIPYGAEDFTGDRSLQERVDLISGAAFFVGLASGLSWLAWGAGVPVVMIVGFTAPGTEFHTPYRVTGCSSSTPVTAVPMTSVTNTNMTISAVARATAAPIRNLNVPAALHLSMCGT